MQLEFITEVDENNSFLGLRPREDFYHGKHIHRAVHLLLANSKGEVAIMKRSPNKRWYPNLYTFSVSGTVENEPNEVCIKREIQEEIGLEITPKELFTIRHSDDQDDAFATIYAATSDIALTPDPREISAVDWVTLDWLKEDIENNPEKYTHPMRECMKSYFNKYGTELTQ